MSRDDDRSLQNHRLPLVDAQVVAPARPRLCRFLRAKVNGRHGDPEALERLRGESTAIFWCLLTQSSSGPDDGLAHVELCGSERRCVDELP